MTINKLLIDFDRTFSDITNKLSESVREEFTNNQVDFCLNVGTENIEGMFSDLPDGPGIYFFEVGFKDLYQQEINVFKDPDAWNESGKTEFEVKKSYFYGILNQIWNELEEIDRGRGESYPKIIKKRFDFHFNKNTSKNSFENDDWVPFYIGKHKNIKYRVLEHIKRSGMKLADFIT
ncbi:hypothetical protein AB4Z17_33040, partial [Paenibacillus sp. TAF43_2]|uniref:hypothetical protein n=1 Tax=Paenibacillus sp. TAF43_2 TaxID=3233069 RepID=UPI003F9C66A7